MVDPPDLTNCVSAIRSVVENNVGPRGPEAARQPVAKQERRDRGKAYRTAVEELRKATGSSKSEAQNSLQLIQVAVSALRWQEVDRHIGELGELVRVVTAQDSGDQRYATLTELATARHSFSQSIKRLGKGSAGGTAANADTAESAKAARGSERHFVLAWNKAGEGGP